MTEKRWWCKGCKSYVPEDKLVENHLNNIFPDQDFGYEHCRTITVSPSGGRLIGCHMETRRCGEVFEVEVSEQELFIEWLESQDLKNKKRRNKW